jgi:hypothetical protein
MNLDQSIVSAPAETRCTAFEGVRRIAGGRLADVALVVKEAVDRVGSAPVLVFDDTTGRLIDLDLRGTAEEVQSRLAGDPPAPIEDESPRRPGRPKLGVVAREVTLLPRHWEWLNSQPGGASVALRKLVEEARRANAAKDRARQLQEAAYRFITAMAGNEPGYEEATRALFAGDDARFEANIRSWPSDIRDHARRMFLAVLDQPGAANGEERTR